MAGGTFIFDNDILLSSGLTKSFGRGAEDEVTTMRWFGGKALSGTAMGVGDMVDQFETLEFLT